MAIATRNDFFTKAGQGLGFQIVGRTAAGAATTNAAAASGHFTNILHASELGSTYPTTYKTLEVPAGLPNDLLIRAMVSGWTTSAVIWLAHFYKIGTLSLTATGDQFTHDAATFPVTRTQFGEAAKPLALAPYVQITTTLAATAAVFRMRTAAGAAGYTDQDGNTVIGAKTMTMPSATTAAQSTYLMRLEDGDSGVRDISAIEVTTAATAGAATLWGVERLCAVPIIVADTPMVTDALFTGLSPMNLKPGAPTSGSLTSFLGFLRITAGTTAFAYALHGTLNT
jgi:hypothetical protein